uniref:SH2 domain containing 5 n=1 Tax=Phasianus colchicus TaxID=9054 RepID=A0A669QUC1_PHACC
MKKKMTANGRGPDPAPPPLRTRGITRPAEVRPLGCRVPGATLKRCSGGSAALGAQLPALQMSICSQAWTGLCSHHGPSQALLLLQTLLMAHALRRILYSTCLHTEHQFAFVARNPCSPPSSLFCHLFVGPPAEVHVLHLLLCRSFQLCYLQAHPELQEAEPDPLPLLREPLNPEEVSRNVNALLSLRRLPAVGPLGAGVERRMEAEGRAVGWHPGNPYCSPVLVRKKAIRSKVLRSGAYRDCGAESQLQQRESAPSGWESRSARGLALLPDTEAALAESVWAFAGIARAGGVALLHGDVPGAFLLRPEAGGTPRWCLWVRAPCGVVPYSVLRTQQGRFCVEHSHAEFRSMPALLAHYSAVPGGCFCRLSVGHRNPGYEQRDEDSPALVQHERG